MQSKLLRIWKKVLEKDLNHILCELRNEIQTPALIILTGEMGAGKTTFCRHFVTDGELSSPTYSIIHETPSVAHADLYRVESLEELIHLELSLYLDDKKYFLVEWGKNFISYLVQEVPDDFVIYEVIISALPPSSGDLVGCRNYELYKLEI